MEEFKSNTDREKEQPQLVRETKPLVQGKLKKKDNSPSLQIILYPMTHKILSLIFW